MTFRTRSAVVHHAIPQLRSTACLTVLVLTGMAIGSTNVRADTETSPVFMAATPVAHPVTAWAASVHAALTAQAHHAIMVARKAFTQSGVASWYGHDFAGKRTSSGVRFDPTLLTAAHRTLPLGTRVLVTSQETGRSVVVTVNDRGPYAGTDRIIDLSRAAAVRLGMVKDGLNNVTVERIAPAGTDIEVAQAADADSSGQAIAAAGH